MKTVYIVLHQYPDGFPQVDVYNEYSSAVRAAKVIVKDYKKNGLTLNQVFDSMRGLAAWGDSNVTVDILEREVR